MSSPYMPARRRYHLDFAGTEYDGLRVRAVAKTLGQVLAMAEQDDELSGLGRDGVMARLEVIVDAIDEWNLADDDGHILPISVQSLLDQEQVLVDAIGAAYLTAITQAPRPLPTPSEPGDQEVSASIPMEPLTPSGSLLA